MKIVSFNINSIRARPHQIEHLRDTIVPEINAMPNGTEINPSPNVPSSQTIELISGWSMFSTYMIPEDMDITTNLSSIVDQLIIVKDVDGSVYYVEWNFNGIGDLERGFGYQLKIYDSITDFNLCNY